MNKKIKISSNRSFGIVFFIFFLIIGMYPILKSNEPRIWSLTLSIIFLLLGILNSKALQPLNLMWFKLGLFLGSIISPVVMGAIFFLVVAPTGLIVKIFKRNFLGLKFDKKLKSYWIEKENINSTMKDQF